ncbi:MAG: hypothetical protein ISR65_00320 [Bacteriovoracaceae bacterium]|nr:hypothetical protein [Bacteriovoracaceae bacterium]
MNLHHVTIITITFLLGLSPLSYGRKTIYKGQGDITFENYVHKDDHDTNTMDNGSSTITRIEAIVRRGRLKGVLRGFIRANMKDDNQTFMAAEDAYIKYTARKFSLLAGFKLFNWSATEIFHPADIVNSRNLGSGVEKTEKFGELVASLDTVFADTDVSLYVFPRFERPKYPSTKSRLGYTKNIGKIRWMNADGELSKESYDFQWGLRLAKSIGNADLEFHFLNIIDRHDPIIAYEHTTGQLYPVYFKVLHFGTTYQHAFYDNWMLKVEGAYRKFDDSQFILTITSAGTEVRNPESYGKFAFGLEYGFSHNDGSDSTVILEGQSIIGLDKLKRAQTAVFQNDLMLGIRHNRNNIYGTEFFASAVVDIERSHEYIFTFSWTERLNDSWKWKAGLKIVDAPQKLDDPLGLEAFNDADQFTFDLIRYF